MHRGEEIREMLNKIQLCCVFSHFQQALGLFVCHHLVPPLGLLEQSLGLPAGTLIDPVLCSAVSLMV